MARPFTTSPAGGALALALLLSTQVHAGSIQGSVQFPEEVKGGSMRQAAYWRVANGVLPVAAALHDVRAEAVVVLVPQGTVSGAQVAAQEEQARRGAPKVEVRVSGLRISPPVVVVPPGATVTLVNEDRLPHTILCTNAPLPRQLLAPGARLPLQLEKPGEYVLRSQEHAHMTGAVLAIDRGFYGRVEPSGTFQFEAPDGAYTARVFWRGAWGPSQQVEVGAQGPDVVLKSSVPGLRAPAPPPAGKQP